MATAGATTYGWRFSGWNGYSATKRLLGLPGYLGHAGDAGTIGMRNAFGF